MKHTKKYTGIWINSFKAVNLHPVEQLPFKEWCHKIDPFMQAANSFDLVTQSNDVDTYLLLTAFWQAMSPAEKRLVVRMVDSHKYCWSVACVQQLKTELKVNNASLPSLQTASWLAMGDPTHLDRSMEDVVVSMCSTLNAEAAEVESN